jgi:hypothetical protein
MQPPPGSAPFRSRCERLLATLPAELRARHVADARLLALPAAVAPWTDAGIEVAAGDELTLLAAGRVVLSEALDLWGGPRLWLWGRIAPGGEIWNPPGDTTTIRADRGGRLELGIQQGGWKSPRGDLAVPAAAQAGLGGGLDVLAIRWLGDAAAGIAALRALAPGDPLLAAEAERLAAPVAPPEGWAYLWSLGAAEIFRDAREDGAGLIRLHAENDVGILRRPVDFALDAGTRLSWRWRVRSLPADRAEDTLPTHDYLSVALEVEDGRDLTWYWSAALPTGTHYACPLPGWHERETHLVVRSGGEGLGAWCVESRPVLADWARAVGGPAPARAAAIWLIAVSLFRHGTAAADFAAIELASGARRLRVLR